MTEEHVPAQVTREEAQHYILLTLDRFRVMTLHLAENKSRLPSALKGNEGGLDLLYELEARDFYRNLMFLYTSDIFEVLSSEGLRELLLKCRELSDRFCLKVRIAEDIRVVGESLTSEPTLSQAVDADKESLWDSFLGALQGEFNEDPSIRSIFMDMGLNLIPLVGQAMDARDIIACLDKLVRQKRHQEIMVWVTLVLTAIGCVPGAGDVIKSIGKAIIKGADDITITLLKKLDAEDIHTAFVKFRQTLQASTEEAVATINVWLKKAENRYKETDLAELLSATNECMNKAVEFVQAKIDEFGRRVFGEGNVPDETKLLEKRDRGKTIITKEFTSNPFQDDGKLKPNIKYAAGEHNYYYETDELGRICKCSADELKLKEHLGRLKHNPNTPGKLEGDHAGHLVADVFGGSPELDNLVSQAKDVNFKQYRDIERAWEKALKKIPPDEITDLKIEIIYDGKNTRPTAFKIEYCINGDLVDVPPIPNN